MTVQISLILFVERVWRFVLVQYWRCAVPALLKAKGVEVGRGVRFYGFPIVSVAPSSRIVIGDNVVLCSDSRFTDLGVSHPVVLRTLHPGAEIHIGANAGLSGTTVCARRRVVLGEECLVGADVKIVDTDFHPIRPKGRRFNTLDADIKSAQVCIGRNVFIGAGAVVLKGVMVGSDSVIGAGSVVSKSVPDKTIVVGVAALRALGGVE